MEHNHHYELAGLAGAHPHMDNAAPAIIGPVAGPAPMPVAGAVNDDRGRFSPGSIIVHHEAAFASMLPIEILPIEFRETCWEARNLSWYGFIEQTQRQLGVIIDENVHQIMAEVGQQTLMHVTNGSEWRRAMQLCHDQGMRQCVFRILGEDVVVEPQQGVEVAQRAARHGWGGMAVVAVPVVGLAYCGAAAMGYAPALGVFMSL